MRQKDISRVISRLEIQVKSWGGFHRRRLERKKADPFRTLVSCVISLRTRDGVTSLASSRLFRLADTPEGMASLKERRIEKAIYPAGFYRNKARQISRLSRRIVEQYGGRVPDTVEELVSFEGVGRKTANLVVSRGYGRPAICVDTHVHRIMNRLGYVRSGTPDETESALRKKLPRRYWIDINPILVSYGQEICTPVSPWCSRCAVKELCDRNGVRKSR